MDGHTILAIAWVTSVFSFLFAAVVFWRRRRTAFSAGPLPWVLAALMALTWAFCSWTVLIEPELLVVRRVTVTSDRWSGPPVTIGLIADTHVGSPHVSPSRMERVVRRMNAEAPDLVLLLGDYAPGHIPARERSRAENGAILDGLLTFRRLSPPLGVFAVIGNHDNSYSRPRIADGLAKSGATLLANQALLVRRPGGDFWIGGLASRDEHHTPPMPALALQGVPAAAPVILAMHEPDAFAATPPGVALTVAGHTHCGQVNLPFVGRPLLPSPGSYRWPCGLYDEGGRKLYVTGGVGTSILPVRIGAPPEIVVVELRAPKTSRP